MAARRRANRIVHVPTLADFEVARIRGESASIPRRVLWRAAAARRRVDRRVRSRRAASRARFTRARRSSCVETFADQAVIAIENARLFDEVQARTRDLEEALQQQTATADVLKVISRSAFDLQAVFDDAGRLGASSSAARCSGTICIRDGDVFRYGAAPAPSVPQALDAISRGDPIRDAGTRDRSPAAVLLTGQVERIPDCLADPEYVRADGLASATDARRCSACR